MSDQFSSLDDLFREAKAARIVEQRAKEAKAAAKNGDGEHASTLALFQNADNWTRTRGIALIHEETETLLGNFSEYIHRSVPGCRKLLREELPISVEATERVSGSWWLGAERKIEPKQSWHKQRPAILHLHLDKLRVHSPATEVMVHLSYDSIARCELVADTQFAQEDGQQEQLLWIPAGTNLLEVMSRDCKINLRTELGI